MKRFLQKTINQSAKAVLFSVCVFGVTGQTSVIAASINHLANDQQWVGQYQCPQGSTPLIVQLKEVSPGDAGGRHQINGVFQFGGAGQPAGAYLVTGAYSTGNQSIRLMPAGWLDHPQGFVAVGLIGKLSADGKTLSGRITHPSCGAISLALKTDTAGLGNQTTADTYIRQQPQNPAASSPTPNETLPPTIKNEPDAAAVNINTTPNERCESYLKWSDRLKLEFPNKNINRMSAPELSMHYARLFDDAHFVPYFGKPYSEMEISELEDIGRNTIMRCKKASPEFKQASASMDVLLKSFLATRQATSDRTPATQASLKLKTGIIRNARAELNLLRDEVERMQPGIAAYERIVDIQKRIPALLDPIWPSEHTGLISHFENKRISFVGPALTDLVDQAVARGSDWNGLEALRQLPEQKKQLFEQAGSGHAKAQMDKIRNQQAITLSNLMLEEAIAAKNFPVSLVGLEKGSLWYQSFHEKYLKHAEYNQHPSVTKVDKIFWEKRNATINASDAELSALVAAAKTTKDARNVVDEYLWLYQDEQNPVAQKIKKNASAAVDRILISSTQADKQKLDRMPGNLDGLHASAFWHETFQAQYGSDREHPLVKALEKHFIERRNAIVAASKSAVTKEISTAQSSYDIDEIWRKYLKSPYDQTSLIISDLKEISINRLERLKLKSILAGGLIENEKSKNGEPTEENMYFAAEGYIRTGLSGMEAVKQIPILGEFANISERITGKQSVNIGYFKKNGCQPADHKKRYLCDYTLKLDVKTEGGMKEASAFMQSFFVMPGNTTGYFTHNGSKWVRSDTEAQIETDARNAREQSERFARESKELHDRGTEALHDYLRGPPSVRQ